MTIPGRPRQLTISAKELLILSLLVQEGELYGLQLVAASKGRLKRGTVYVTLGRMEDKGLIRSRPDAPPEGEGGMPRPLYALTALGQRAYKSWTRAAVILPEFVR